MYSTDRLVDLCQRYALARGIKATTLGRLTVGNSTLLDRIHTGRITIRTIERLIQYLSNHWPADVEWPADIPRPLQTSNNPEEAA